MFKVQSVSVFRAPKAGGQGHVDVISFEGDGLVFCRDIVTASDVRRAKAVAEKYRADFVVSPKALRSVNVALCGGELPLDSSAPINVESMHSYQLCAGSGGLGMAVAMIDGLRVHCHVQENRDLKVVKQLPEAFKVHYSAFSAAA